MIKREKLIATALGLLFGSSLFLVACQEEKPTILPPVVDENPSYCVTYELPSDGSKPTEHTGLENIGYMAGQLAKTENYHVEISSDVTANIVISYVQHVETIKDYQDGVMVAQDIATSAFVNTASQACFMDDSVYMRKPVSNKVSDWNGVHTEWQEGKPSKYTLEQYLPLYGLPSTTFSSYVINEETLLTSSEVTDLGNGLYSQTYTFHPEKSSAYYRSRMKTMGGLADYPDMQSITATYVFDGNWRVQSTHYEEHYGFKLNSLIKTDRCSAVTDSTYSYGTADISDYTDFYSKYRDIPAEPPKENETLTAGDCLMEAFSPVLAGEATYNVEAQLRDKTLSGKLSLNLEESCFVLAIGELTLGYNGSNVLLSYRDLNGRIPLATLLAYLSPKFGEGDVDLNDFDTDSILDSFAEGDFLDYPDSATLETSLKIEEESIPLFFTFAKDGEEISLDSLKATIFLEGEPILLTLTEGEGAPDMPRGTADLSAYLDLIFDFVNTDVYGFDVSYADDTIELNAALSYAPKDGLSGGASLKYGELSLTTDLALVDGIVYLDLHSINEEALSLKVSCALEALPLTIPALFDEISDESYAIADILYEVLSLDYGEVIQSLQANRTVLNMWVNADLLLPLLGVEEEIGNVELVATKDTLSASVAGVNLVVRPKGSYLPPEGAYENVSPIASALPELLSFVASENYYASLSGTFSYHGKDYPVKGEAKLQKIDEVWNYIFTVSLNGIRVDLLSDGREVTLILPNLNMEVKAKPDEAKKLFSDLAGRISIGDGGEIETAIALAPILESFKMLPEEESLFSFELNLSSLLDGLSVRAKVKDDSASIALSTLTLDEGRLSGLNVTLSSGADRYVRYKEAYSVLYSGDVYSIADFLDSDAYRIQAGGDLLSVDAIVCLNGTVWGDVHVLGKTLSFAYLQDTIYLSMGEYKVKCTVAAIRDAVEELLGENGIPDLSVSVQVSDLIEGVLNLNFNKIKLVSRGNELKATLYLHDLLGAFGLDIDIERVDFAYHYDTQTLHTDLFGIPIVISRAGRNVYYPGSLDGYVSLDAFLRALQHAITFEGGTSVKVQDTNVDLSVLGEINFENALSIFGVVTAKVDSATIYVTFDYDGTSLKLSFGEAGVSIRKGDTQILLTDLKDTLDSVISSIRNAPEGSKELVYKLIAVIASLEVLDNLDLDAIFDQVQDALEQTNNASEILNEILGFFTADDRFALEIEEEKITITMHAPASEEIDFSDVVLVLRPTKGVVAENEFFLAGKDADFWTLAEAQTLLSSVRATAALVENDYFTLGYQFDIYNDDAAYGAYNGLRFTASGKVQVYTGDDPSLNGSYIGIDLTLIASNHEKDGDLYMTLLAYDGDKDGETDFYITASRYPEGDANRAPLKLMASQGELRKLIETVLTFAGVDFKYYDGVLSDDMIQRIEVFAKSFDRSALTGSLNDLTQKADSALGTMGSDTLLNSYLKELSLKDGLVTLRIDGAKLFGKEGLSDLTLTVEMGENDVIEGVGLQNVYLISESETERIDMALTMGCESFPVGVPSDLQTYIDADGIYDMLEMLFTSATHTEGEGYALNREYAISGDVTLSVLGIYNVDVAVGIDVRPTEDALDIDIRIKANGAKPLVTLINGDTVSDVSIHVPKEGAATVSVRRVQSSDFGGFLGTRREITPVIIYRNMPLQTFLDDMLEQFGFILNFGDTIMDQIGGAGGETPSETDTPDYGAYLISYTKAENSFALTLSGKNLTGGLLSDVTIALNHRNQNLTSLNVSTSLYGVISMSMNLDYHNPGENVANVPAITEQIGEETRTMFGVLYDETKFIEGKTVILTFRNGSEVVATKRYIPGSQANVAPDVSAYGKIGYTASWDSLPEAATSDTVISVVLTPNVYEVRLVSDYEAEGFVLENGKYVKVLSYTYDTVLTLPSVSISSEDYAFGGWLLNGAPVTTISGITESVELTMEVVERVVINLNLSFNGVAVTGATEGTVTFDSDYSLPELSAEGYAFLGWWSDRSGEWQEYTSALALESGDTLTAMWLKTDVALSVSNASRTGNLFSGYRISANLSLETPVASAQIADRIQFTYSISWINNTSSATPSSYGMTLEGQSGSISNKGSALNNYIHAVGTITYTLGDRTGSIQSSPVDHKV